MDKIYTHIKAEEKYILQLSALYERFGYKKYNMRHFEEYSLYAENKNFLVNDSVITFTDLNGKLMALKPDVTLSIVKHAETNAQQRVYYTESVYRPDRENTGFSEITQTGLEHFGNIDDYTLAETVYLAAASLAMINNKTILELSHVGFIDSLLADLNLTFEQKDLIKTLIAEKNVHELEKCVDCLGITDSYKTAILAIPFLNGNSDDVFEKAGKHCINDSMRAALNTLKQIINTVCNIQDNMNLSVDLSMYGDSNYYSAILMAGYVYGLPSKVLSGGQYDRMVSRFGKKFGAVGFAIYISEMERVFKNTVTNNKILVKYSENTDPKRLLAFVAELTKQGKIVYTSKLATVLNDGFDEIVSFKGDTLC